MKVFKLIVGYILNAILGFVYYPLIEYAVALIQGTVNGPAYTIHEPELSSYNYQAFVEYDTAKKMLEAAYK